MLFSKHNIFSKIKDSDNWFILNPLVGSADLLSPVEAHMLNGYIEGKDTAPDFLKVLEVKGYSIEPESEKKLYRKKYLDFIDAREKDEVQLFFVTNYSCNFGCPYCYQDEYQYPETDLTEEKIDAFFRYVLAEFSRKNKYLTIFGGEPLLNSPRQKELISYLIQKANTARIDVCIVTNGFTLSGYLDLLKTARIREIQVTLDGTAEVHDSRRFLKNGGKTFGKIVEGIDACLKEKIPVNLRMVVDKQNISNLPEIARFAIEKGWTKDPLFKTQLGRNYELHHCQADHDKLFSRISLYEAVFELTKMHPEILEFHKPAYSVAKFLEENGNLPDPLFDSCPACKTEWAFDFTGQIYPCTATVGKENESLGTYFPIVTKMENLINDWENRDVTSIDKCRECNLQLACGGGCGSVAKNSSGSICSADCRPVKEILEIGFSAYLDHAY